MQVRNNRQRNKNSPPALTPVAPGTYSALLSDNVMMHSHQIHRDMDSRVPGNPITNRCSDALLSDIMVHLHRYIPEKCRGVLGIEHGKLKYQQVISLL